MTWIYHKKGVTPHLFTFRLGERHAEYQTHTIVPGRRTYKKLAAAQANDVRFGSKVGQIGPKQEKSETFIYS